MKKSLIISASPLAEGRTAQLVRLLVENQQSRTPGDEVKVFSLSGHHIEGCMACDKCKDDFTCIIDDDMQMLYPWLDEADELTIVSPVFFAGPPSQLKALLDRMQPYFWKRCKTGLQKKRPAKLFVLGEGGDPHGFSPLVISVRSALAVVGFSLDDVFDGRRLKGEALKKIARYPEPYRVDGEALNSPIPPRLPGDVRA